MQVATSSADLSDADLSDANLSGADLSSADLSDADLSDADLSVADLRNTKLTAANLSSAVFWDKKSRSGSYITSQQIKEAKNWEKAVYTPAFRKQLGLTLLEE